MAYVAAIIPAAGYGKRMQSSQNKQFMQIKGKPVLAHTINIFEKCEEIAEIIVVVRSDELDVCRELVCKYGFRKIKSIVAGGAERQDSVWNGLKEVSSHCETVVVHDGARPLLLQEILVQALQESKLSPALAVGVPVKDTIKIVDNEQHVLQTPERKMLWAVQTPQIFRKDILSEAYLHAKKSGFYATDDAGLVEALGIKVKMVMGSYENIKITTPEDILVAELFLTRRTK